MVDLQGGKATIVPVPGGMVRPDAIFNALSAAGFRGDAVTLDVKGTVRQVGGVPVLTLPGHADPYLELRGGAAPDGEVRLRIRVAPGQPAEVIERKEGAALGPRECGFMPGGWNAATAGCLLSGGRKR